MAENDSLDVKNRVGNRFLVLEGGKISEYMQSPTGKYILVGTHTERFVMSSPPAGCYKITNIWRDAAGNLKYEYENEPQP